MDDGEVAPLNTDEEIMHEEVLPTRTYVVVYVVLMGLLGLTVGASFVDMGRLNWVVAMTIAVVKAMLVALYFMHVLYSTRLTRVFAAAGIVWLTILILGTLHDYLTRYQIPTT